VKYEKHLGKTLFLVYFWVRGSNIHETVIFNVISRILDASRHRWASWLGRWATVYFSDMCSFSKIDFPDSLIVRLSWNFDILTFDRLDRRLDVYSLRNVSRITAMIFGFVIINFLRNFGVRIMIVGCAWLYGIVGT